MSVKPRYLSPNMENPPIPLVERPYSRKQRRLRTMSPDPTQPRIFSYAPLNAPIWLPFAAVATGIIIWFAVNNTGGFRTNLTGWLMSTIVLAISYSCLADCLWHRFGVDQDKVWTRFGHLGHREIRFNEITHFDADAYNFKLRAGKTKITANYHYFDYALLCLRLLEELHHRRIHLPQARADDPNGDQEAQKWRNILAGTVWMEHRDFYDNHPEALAQLNTLIAPPTMYQASSGSSLDDPSYGALQQAHAEHDDNRHLDFNSASQVAQSLPPLHLSNVRVSAQPTSAEVRHLLRDTEYGYTLRIRFDTADGDSVVFDGNEFEPLDELLMDPAHVVIGTGPYLTGTDFPDTPASELAKKHHITVDCLILYDVEDYAMTGHDQLIATINSDEIPQLHAWVDRFLELVK